MAVIQTDRRRDESELDYHKRIVYGKLDDKSLADESYTDLAELIYGKPYASDVARRMFYGSYRTLQLMDKTNLSGVSGTDILNEIDSKTVELRKERQKLSDQRREWNKLISVDARLEHLYERLAESAA